MKITFLLRPDGGLYFGGAEVQALQTARSLRKLGADVEIMNSERTEIGDIVHAFGNYASHLSTMEYCRARGIPFVLSPIFYKNVKFKFQLLRERPRSLRRHNPSWVLKNLILGSDAILPNTQAEADQIDYIYKLKSNKIHVVPNAAEDRFAQGSPDLFRAHYNIQEPFVLNVARIEKRKNQLRLIEAVQDLNIKLVIIGKEEAGEYSSACRALANGNSNVLFLPPIPHDSEMLSSAYAAARVFALPSILETPGIAALEAGLAGAAIVTTPIGGGQEYFDNMAAYVNPKSVSDIRMKIETAWHSSSDPNLLRQHIKENFSWAAVAKKTISVYENILSKARK